MNHNIAFVKVFILSDKVFLIYENGNLIGWKALFQTKDHLLNDRWSSIV